MAEKKTSEDDIYYEEIDDQLLEKYLRENEEIGDQPVDDPAETMGEVTEAFKDDPTRLAPETEATLDPYVPEEVEDFADRTQELVFEGIKNFPEYRDLDREELRKIAIRFRNGAMRSYGKDDIVPYSIPEDPKTLFEALVRAASRRSISVAPLDAGETVKTTRIRETREVSQDIQELSDKEGPWGIMSKILEGSGPISVEQAEKTGMGYTKQKFFGRAPEDEEDLFFIPYGIKNLDLAIERASEKLAVGSIFAPFFLKEDEKEAYKKTTNLALPTENFEQLVDRYEFHKDQGLTREEIRQKHDEEFNRMLISQTYDDLPFGFQLNKPSVENFKLAVDENSEFLRRYKNEEIDTAIRLVGENKSDKEIQKFLNRIPFAALPASVWAGTIPSTDELLTTLFDSIENVIEAKGRSGVYGRTAQKSIESFIFDQEKIGDELVMVENTFGKVMRLLGISTEAISEIDVSMGVTKSDVKNKLIDLGLSEENADSLAEYAPYAVSGVATLMGGPLGLLPLTPASRDFYYEYGLRDPDTGWLARFAANIQTANIGVSAHLTNEAIALGYSRGDAEYHSRQALGHTIDMITPWERLLAKYPIAIVRGTSRGSKIANQFDLKGGWKSPVKWKVALAGGSPSAYNRLYNISENVSFAVNAIENQIGGKIDGPKLKQLLDEDTEVYNAKANEEPIPTDVVGKQKRSLSYAARNIAEQIFEKIEDGIEVDTAIEQLKKNYKPDAYETIYHALYTVIHHLQHTDEGVRMFKNRKNDTKGILPFELEQQLDRSFISAGLDPRQVKTAARKQAEKNKQDYTKNLKAAYYVGDADTVQLRNSKQYQKVNKDLDQLVEKGTIDVDQKIVLLSLLENRSYAAAADNQIKISTPQDFFGKVEIDTISRTIADEATPSDIINVKVGRVLDITSDNINSIRDMYKTGNFSKLLENDSQILVDLMGKRWASRFIGRKHNEVNPNFGSNTTKRRLNAQGKKQVEEILRKMVSGVGRLDGDASDVASLYENLQAMYTRMRLESGRFIDPVVAGRLDLLLRPDRFHRNELVQINIENAPRRPGSTVYIDRGKILEQGERLRQASQKRPIFDVDVHPDSVRQVLGITDETRAVDAIETYSRALAYVMTETFKKNESKSAIGGRRIQNLTDNTLVTDDKAESIVNRVNARMGSILGISKQNVGKKQSYLDPVKLIDMANAKDETLTLNAGQQARLKVFLRRLGSEPIVGRRIPDDLIGANADLSTIKMRDYSRVIELMLDVEASGVSRRTTYTEAIPKSLGYSILGAFKRGLLEPALSSEIDFIKNTISKIQRLFVLDDPMYNVRPQLKELFKRQLKSISETPRDIVNIARTARRGNPEAAIEEIFESMTDILVNDFDPEQVELISGVTKNVGGRLQRSRGIVSVINDLTDAEISRINLEYKKLSEQDKSLQIDSKKQADIISGQDELTKIDPGELEAVGIEPDLQAEVTGYSFEIPSGVSRMQFLTQNATQELLTKACSRGGVNGITERVSTALTILQSYSSETGLTTKQIAKMSDSDRVAIGEALMVIKDRIEQNDTKIQQRGLQLLRGLGGETLELDRKASWRASETYNLFYSGEEGWPKLYELAIRERGKVGLTEAEISRYSPSQALLEMIVRMATLDKLDGLYDLMIKNGMPGAKVNYRTPKRIVSPTGAQYSIETPSMFHQRVKGHMHQIFTYGDLELRTRPTDDMPSEMVEPKRAITNVIYDYAAFEKPPGRRPAKDFQDLQALLAAEEAMARFGHRTALSGDALVDMTFPDGTTVTVPRGMEIELKNAIDRVSRIGSAYMTDPARVLRQADVDTPYADVPSEVPTKQIVYSKVGRAINNLFRFFPLTTTLIKQGITTGFIIPMAPYYVANYIGGYFQLMTAVGPVDATRVMLKNPGMASSVTMRMYGENKYNPGAKRLLVTKSGQIYTQKQLSEMALMYGLDSSFIQAETQRSMAEDIKQYIRKDQRKYSYKKLGDYARAWNDHLKEAATAIDNFYRVSIFIDGVEQGISPGQAAQTARKAAFDYGALTEFEKRVMRQTIMFYSYLRNNMNLFYDTLLIAPDRVFNQLRLANGLQQEFMETERQVGMPSYLDGRLPILALDTFINSTKKEKRMNFLPPLPIMDSLNLAIDPYDALMGDQEAQRQLATRLVPWLQAPIVYTTDIDPFYGGQIDNFNKVPAHLLDWDLIVTGGMLREALQVVPYTLANPALRPVEGDDDRPVDLAGNGLLWWSLRNLVQIPPFGRYITVAERVDRANLGFVEGITETGISMRKSLEERGLVEEVTDRIKKGDSASPKVGNSPAQELLGALGMIPAQTETQGQVADKMFKDFKRKTKTKLPRYQDPYEQAEEKQLYRIE